MTTGIWDLMLSKSIVIGLEVNPGLDLRIGPIVGIRVAGFQAGYRQILTARRGAGRRHDDPSSTSGSFGPTSTVNRHVSPPFLEENHATCSKTGSSS